jgi:SAM-dependent methyltransferase
LLDFGCGSGAAFAHLRRAFPDARIIGFEPEPGLRAVAEVAAAEHSVEVLGDAALAPRGGADVVYCNGVFHHIPLDERAAAMRDIRLSLRAGGLAFVWENSPYNPGTRLVMSRIPFDRNARLLKPRSLRALLAAHGLEHHLTEFHFVFPRALAFLRPVETAIRGLPLGGQYVVMGRAQE